MALGSSLLGAVTGGVFQKAAETPGKVLNQAIDISVGNINPKEIIKYAIYFFIIIAVFWLALGFVRGIMVGMEQVSCGLSHICVNPSGCGGYEHACDPFSTDPNNPTIIRNTHWAIDIEWAIRCLMYLDLAVIIGLLLYQYCNWLFNKLLTIDREIKKIENWIYGFGWEGEAERRIETRL
jgi:hypothetical protein